MSQRIASQSSLNELSLGLEAGNPLAPGEKQLVSPMHGSLLTASLTGFNPFVFDASPLQKLLLALVKEVGRSKSRHPSRL